MTQGTPESEVKVVEVRLVREGDSDYLIFDSLIDDKGDALRVELSGEANAQNELKRVFSALLKIIQSNEVKLNLTKEECEDNGLFQMVADDYIAALSEELKSTREHYLKAYSELSLD